MSQVQLNVQNPPLLELNHIKVTYGRGGQGGRPGTVIKAVDDVSLVINEGELVSLVGESGSGKTTLARVVLEFIRPQSGSIQYRGSGLRSLRGRRLKEYRKNVQIVFQDPYECLNPRQDVFTIVSMPMRHLLGMKDRNEMYNRVSKLLVELKLDPSEAIRKYPHQLSGGERQRVNLARALASDPEMLVADEPLTMLDAAQRLSTLVLFSELKKKRNLTVLMITHDLASAKMVSDRVFVMYRGKVVEAGPTGNVLTVPLHPYTKTIMAATPDLDRRIPTPSKMEYDWDTDTVAKGCNYRPLCRYATQICAETEPPLEDKGGSHFAACHNSRDVIEDGAQVK